MNNPLESVFIYKNQLYRIDGLGTSGFDSSPSELFFWAELLEPRNDGPDHSHYEATDSYTLFKLSDLVKAQQEALLQASVDSFLEDSLED